jgi:uncharacterized protein
MNMVTRDTAWAAGTPCWVDLGADDPGRARAFYSGLFGWQITEEPPEAGGYSMCALNGKMVAGIGPRMGPPGTPAVWTTYLATDNADATADKITAAGGQVISEPFDVMNAGRMAIATDPAGAVFGIWQSNAHTGFQLANEPGALIWTENMSPDLDGSKAFYQAVFGFAYGDIPGDFQYATLDLPAGMVGGIGEVQPGEPAHWGAYFAVADTDAAAAKAIELGGRVISPPSDTPYGRMATLSDDQGAVFSLMSVPSGPG